MCIIKKAQKLTVAEIFGFYNALHTHNIMGMSRPSLLIESIDSMTGYIFFYFFLS